MTKDQIFHLTKQVPSLELSIVVWWRYIALKLPFSYLGFLSRIFTNHRTVGEGGGYFFKSSLLLPPTSQTLRHQAGNYCRELTSAHSQQLASHRETLVSDSLTTKLRALETAFKKQFGKVTSKMGPCFTRSSTYFTKILKYQVLRYNLSHFLPIFKKIDEKLAHISGVFYFYIIRNYTK